MNFLQHYSGGWNVEAIALLGVLWFVLVPVVACVVAARVFEERERGETTGRSVFYGLVVGGTLAVLSTLALMAIAGLLGALAAPLVAVVGGVLVIRAYYRAR